MFAPARGPGNRREVKDSANLGYATLSDDDDDNFTPGDIESIGDCLVIKQFSSPM